MSATESMYCGSHQCNLVLLVNNMTTLNVVRVYPFPSVQST
jgi:hypothetical protein